LTSSEGRGSGENQPLDRRLERARAHVMKFWFPVNRRLVDKIKSGLQTGVYDLDLDFLLAEIKTDLALFTHCLRRAREILAAEGLRTADCGNPVDLLRWAGLERLRRIIQDPQLTDTRHALENVSPEQLSPMQKALVSASAAEVISQFQNVNPEVGFSAGLLRQLGLVLIAWNYPQAYHDALMGLKPEQDIDLALSQTLGFSPVTLAIAVTREWGLTSEFSAALEGGDAGAAEQGGREGSDGDVAARLRSICEVSETLARANAPELYPQAEHNWQTAKQEIVAIFGSENLTLIQKQVRDNCESYVANYPQLFGGMAELDPSKHIDARKNARFVKENPYLEYCQAPLKRRLVDLYVRLDANKVSRENVAMLVNEIIPAAGYSGGAIFVLDPGTSTLMPRVKIGTMQLLKHAPVAISAKEGMEGVVAAAFEAEEPILQETAALTPEVEYYVVGAIGEAKKIGVLYLEIAAAAPQFMESNRLQRFKALRRAFADCLNL
jgi:hypothetical protein